MEVMKPTKDYQHNKHKNFWIHLITAAILGVVLVVFIQYLTTISVTNFNDEYFWTTVMSYKRAYFFSSIFMYLIYGMLVLIFNNYLIVSFWTLVVTIALSIGNNLKMQVMLQPIFPSDISFVRTLPTLMGMIGSAVIPLILATIFGITVMIVLTWLIWKKLPYFNLIKNRKRRTLVSSLTLLAFVFVVQFLSGYNKPNSLLNKTVDTFGIYPDDFNWDPQRMYNTYGFANGTIMSIPAGAIDKPETIEYNKQNVEEVMDFYQAKADVVNKQRSRSSFEDISVITVLSETLADPGQIPSIEVSPDPLEYIKSDEDKIAGSLLTPAYGGGTANTEYELLSGFNYSMLYPTGKSAFDSVASRNNHLPSLFKQTNSYGNRESLTIHSYNSKFYRRTDSYTNFGADRMIFDKDMSYTYILGPQGSISDRASYDEVMMHYNSSEQAMNIHLVTMQNHTPFLGVDEPYEFDVNPGRLNDNSARQLENYVQGIALTDRDTEAFVESLNQAGKPYVLFLYGDHYPILFSKILNDDTSNIQYYTNYMLVTNIEDSKMPEHTELISLPRVQNMIFEVADVEVNAYQMLLEDVYSTFTAIHPKGYFTHESDEARSFDQLSNEEQQLVETYRLIQYDMIDGRNYSKSYF